MSNVISMPTPRATRANVLAELVRQVAFSPTPVRVVDLFETSRTALDMTEIAASPALWSGIFLLMRTGLIDRDNCGTARGEISIGADSTVEPSLRLCDFMRGEDFDAPPDGGDAA